MNQATQFSVSFFNLDGTDDECRVRVADEVGRYAPAALRKLYEKMAKTPEVARLFTSAEVMEHARSKQLEHWLYLFSRHPDEETVAKAEQVGHVHARIGLEPHWYIGGYAQVLDSVLSSMVGHTIAGNGDPRGLGDAVTSLVKLSLLDISVALSAYFKTEQDRRLAVIDKMRVALRRLAAGDFTATLEGLPDDYASIEADFLDMRQRIGDALGEVALAAGGVSVGAGEIRLAADHLSGRTEMQAASLEESVAALNNLTEGARKSAEDAQAAHATAELARNEADEGAGVLCEAVDAMGGIQRAAVEIGKIVEVIDAIAFQTSLLALNASIEAAQAGDAGRGFGVVAAEVRALAARSAEAAQEIKLLVETGREEVRRGVALVDRSGAAFGAIVERVREVAALVAQIAQFSGQQAHGVAQINEAIGEMDEVTQQNAAMAEESTAAATSLAAEAQRLDALLRRFRVASAACGSHAGSGLPGVAAPLSDSRPSPDQVWMQIG